MVNFVHDEFIVELPADDNPKLQEACRRIETLMVSAMKRYIPDVLIKAEGALSERWDKKAKGLHDEQGNLLLWTPELAESMKRAATTTGLDGQPR